MDSRLAHPDRVRHCPDDLAALWAATVAAELRADVAAAGDVEREVVCGLDIVEWANVDGDAVGDQPEPSVQAAVHVDSKVHRASVAGRDAVAHQRFEAAVAVCVRPQD